MIVSDSALVEAANDYVEIMRDTSERSFCLVDFLVFVCFKYGEDAITEYHSCLAFKHFSEHNRLLRMAVAKPRWTVVPS
jgi:hypothetical protein